MSIGLIILVVMRRIVTPTDWARSRRAKDACDGHFGRGTMRRRPVTDFPGGAAASAASLSFSFTASRRLRGRGPVSVAGERHQFADARPSRPRGFVDGAI